MGSGGRGYFNSNPQHAMDALRKAQQSTTDEKYEAECNSFIIELLGSINDRDVSAISRHLDEIRAALGDDLEGTIDLRFGGSVAKHTFVDGLSDVDSLVLLDKCELAGLAPSEAKRYLVDRLRADHIGEAVHEGPLAVTVQYRDIEVQLIPAVSCRGAVQIAAQSGTEWSRIQPRQFARELSRANAAVGYKLVPTIKLAKAIIASLPERQQISGYHAEALAVRAFKGYKGPLDHRTMLRRFFEYATAQVRSSMKDTTGQSTQLDSYLGRSESLERKIISDTFARIGRQMTNADANGSVEQWRRLFEE